MLVVHEVHTLAGAGEAEFEALYRDEWTAALAGGPAGEGDARLLWYLHHAHGTGPSYTAVTITAVRDEVAWGALGDRVRHGDLRAWAARADALRADHRAKVLTPLPWSPLADVDLADVPVEPVEREQALYMEDTAWPHRGKLDEYVERAGTQYVATLAAAEAAGRSLLSLEAAFVSAWGTGRHREVVLWQRVVRPELLLGLLTRDVPEEHRREGTWMHDALAVRDRWESRLLRTATWSPLPAPTP